MPFFPPGGIGTGGGVREVKVLPPEAKGIVYLPLPYYDTQHLSLIHI